MQIQDAWWIGDRVDNGYARLAMLEWLCSAEQTPLSYTWKLAKEKGLQISMKKKKPDEAFKIDQQIHCASENVISQLSLESLACSYA